MRKMDNSSETSSGPHPKRKSESQVVNYPDRYRHGRYNVQRKPHSTELGEGSRNFSQKDRGGRFKNQKKYNEDGQNNSNFKKNYNMGFRYVQRILESEDLEDVIVKLSNDRAGFRQLLENRDNSNDMKVILIKLLAKICESNFIESKRYLLLIALNNNFVDTLITFISTLVIQNEKEKKNNSYFWKDPNEFCRNIACILHTLNDLIPTSSFEYILKILKAIKLYIPIIEDHHSIQFSNLVKSDINNLHDIIEKKSSEVESKETLKETRDQNYVVEPPNDFREISVYPSVIELTTQEMPFLRANVVKGPYQNVNHYLDIQFRLLREDFIAPLRNGICKYIANPKQKLDNIKIYKRIRFLNIETVNDQNCYRVQYDFSNKKKTLHHENSRRFMFGSLLCFTNDNFKTVILGKVGHRDIKDLEKGHLIVAFDEDMIIPENIYDQEYLMIESTVYFEPYYHVLNVLQTMNLENFPMHRYIVRVNTDISPPQYLLRIDPVFYRIEKYSFWPLNWSDRTFYGLNKAQNEALRAALTQEICIIQGPPGTGKTFLGLKIAETLIKNKAAWYNKTPILVICYTNHALDQFLEGLLQVTDDILRIGSRSKNEKLSRFNIKAKRFHVSNPAVRQMRYGVRDCLNDISMIVDTLKQIELNESVVDFSEFSEIIPQYRKSWFGKATNREILNWLLEETEAVDQVQRNDKKVEVNNTQMEHIRNTSNDEDVLQLEEYLDPNNEDFINDIHDDVKVDFTFKPIFSLKALNDRIVFLKHELKQFDTKDGTLQDMLTRLHILAELNSTTIDFHRLKRRLEEVKQIKFPEPPHDVNIDFPHSMSPAARLQLYCFWLDQYRLRLIEERNKLNKEFQRMYKRYNELCDIEDVQIMKDSLVVGITTTAAARLKSSLQTLKSPIVIVEEAAEVLEAHIISSLTSYCQHLILIGDHQQLKPSTANFKVETKYRLGISLFERMVLNNIPCHALSIQHRMRPEISCLIHPTIYPILEDHESVLNRPQILGVENCVYFIDHQEPEEICKDESKKNTHEAKFLINLAKYLILNGYKSENITILAAYLGQMFEMQQERKYCALLQDVRIAVLDNYQGEESDIILLSLVRSNTENKIGFLKIENRVCVALSRAKNGFYMIGNMKLLCENSDIWPKIKESLKKQQAFGPYLTLRCQIHKHKITNVKSSDDFMKVAEGGCDLMCEAQVDCGHICTRLCHVDDADHISYTCKQKCTKVLCDNVEHICKKLCYEECGPCTYPVERNLDCGHTVAISCCIDPATHDCPVLVKTTLPCEHVTEKPCYMDPEKFRCPYPCDVQVQPCGHACINLCHVNQDPDHLRYKCSKPCARARKGCSLQEDEKHPCLKLCFEDCEECNISVKKKRTECSHVYRVPCNSNVDEIECKKPCTKILACGHKCKNECNEPCGNCDVQVSKVVPDCKHEVKLKCSQAADRTFCRKDCPRLLTCGHRCMKKCFENCTTQCNVLVECSISSPCGHIIKAILCRLKDTDDPALLQPYCREKCNSKLKCGHICHGTCGECFQGRIHRRCQEKCGVPLICNHECSVPCRQACKPCDKTCQYKCAHSKCKKKCGDPCTKCEEPCKRACQHQQCFKKCGYICNIPPCYEPCKKLLKCQHLCVGFCGDPCPILCRVCNNEELTTIFLGNEDEENAIYVMLNDCQHIFESSDMEEWLKLDSNAVKPKECPRCKTVIASTVRYNEYIKRSNIDIMNIKKQSYGTQEEICKERSELLTEIEKLQPKSKKLYKDSNHLRNAIRKLTQRLDVSRIKNKQDCRQAINKMDLNALRSKIQMIDYLIDVYNEKNNEVLPTDRSIIQISFILNAIMRDEDQITDQEIEDISLEIERLARIIQFEKIQRTYNFDSVLNKTEIKTKVEKIVKMLHSAKRFSKDTDTFLQTELSELNKLVASSVVITELEKKQIVNAMGFKKGHWFKCPNGHYYVIADCGGANQISKCNECGSPIGGQNHQLLPGQQHAREMDGSQHPAWSEAANLLNYRL